MMIYVPDLENYKCFVVKDSNTLRAYKEIPRNNTEVAYRDYYVNSHYLYNDGFQSFSQYYSLPVCLDNSKLTTLYSYRNDFSDICIIAIILIGTVWCLVGSLLKTLFRGRKLF